jgi:mono/diheme cytochrome c family protein
VSKGGIAKSGQNAEAAVAGQRMTAIAPNGAARRASHEGRSHMNPTRRLALVIAAFAVVAMAVSCAQTSKEATDTAAAAKAAADSAKTAAAVQRGQHLFLSYCAMCHGDGGAIDGGCRPLARDNVVAGWATPIAWKADGRGSAQGHRRGWRPGAG